MANGAGSQAASAQRRVPALDVEAGQLLQRLGAEMWHDLVLDQLTVALRGPGGNITSRLPLGDTSSHEISHGGLARLDIVPLPYRREQLSELGLRIPFAATKCDILYFALAVGTASHIKFQLPRM